MTKGRHTGSINLGRRCSKPGCKKLAKDLIDGEYVCRIHSSARFNNSNISYNKEGKAVKN